MTGGFFNDIWDAAAFSASVAPSHQLSILYGLFGILAAISYKIGSCVPISRRPIHREYPNRSRTSPKASNAPQPSLFVVIPAFIRTFEEAYEIQLALDKLSNVPTVQTMVVDDGSPITFSLDGCEVVRHARNLGPAAARNTGIKLALEYGATSIAFTDADCFPGPDWASSHASLQFSSPGIWAGPTLAYGNDVVSQYCNDVGTLMPRLKDSHSDEAIYGPTCNLSISASIASRINFDSGFPTSAFEDCDFCVRARNAGYKVRVSRAPIVRHRFKGGVFGLIQSYFKYGRSFPLMLAKHPAYKSMLSCSYPMSTLSWRSR